MPDPKKLIIVLGAHRSGTSLCAAALEFLGAELCLAAQYSNEENRKGFFEHPDIVDFNDRLLSHLGGAWDNPLFDGPVAVAKADLTQWQLEACKLIAVIFNNVQVAAIKDPRLCQLLDFWLPVFARCGYQGQDIFIVQVLRDPVEVALSQQHRAKANPAFYEIGRHLVEGASLWLSLTAQALEQTRELNNYFVTYQDLLSSPERVLENLAGFLQLEPDRQRLHDFCEGFVDSSLHRSTADPQATELVARQFPQVLDFSETLQTLGSNEVSTGPAIIRALEVYRKSGTQRALCRAVMPALSRLSDKSRKDRLAVEQSADVILDLERQVKEHSSVIVPLRTQNSQLENGIEELQRQRDAQRAELVRLSSALKVSCDDVIGLENIVGAMEASTSWKLTRPIRRLRSIQLRMIEQAQKGAARFRLRSIFIYHRMSVRHPRFAWISRRALRPFFRLMNIVLPGQRQFAYQTGHDGLLNPMIYQQLEPTSHFAPLISIIVPNYNHAAYLPLRLDSIFSQTYPNFEVILLDDASSDGSVSILAQYHQAHPENSTLVTNEKNSGGVFHQWEKGFKLARGDIIWIAESDDWCTENFLETLVPLFENEAIQLAYTRTVFMNGPGDEQIWSINEYLHDIDPQRWNHNFTDTADKIVAEAFALKNIIPNVSSALLRNPRKLELLQDPQWKEMRTCGDWVLYLHLIRGGMLAYSPEACNYYRMHGENTSVKSHSDDKFYAEHELVAKTVQQYYRVDGDVFKRQRDNLIAHWRETRPSYSEKAFEVCYSLSRIEASASMRAPNLLMASYAFCAGGGETFPVQLANIMKGAGYNVTYLDCAREPRNEGIRQNLRLDIPIVSDFTQLERIVSDFGVDVIHSHHAWVDSTILELLPEDANCKTIVTLHGMYETINDYDLKSILPRLVKRSARLIYVADKNLSALRGHKLLDKASLIRIDNALYPEEFESVLRGDLGIPDDAFVLTLVSRAMKEKGWSEAISAVTGAREISGKDIHLLLVGDGVEHERLAQVELPPYVHLEGFQRNVRGYFAVADMGFLPSKFRGESFPLVLIECLQVGRPVLASALGEIPYMLDSPEGQAGHLVELDGDAIDIPVLVDAIAALATEPDRYQALLDCVPAAARKFDPAILAEKYDRAYRQAAGMLD